MNVHLENSLEISTMPFSHDKQTNKQTSEQTNDSQEIYLQKDKLNLNKAESFN